MHCLSKKQTNREECVVKPNKLSYFTTKKVYSFLFKKLIVYLLRDIIKSIIQCSLHVHLIILLMEFIPYHIIFQISMTLSRLGMTQCHRHRVMRGPVYKSKWNTVCQQNYALTTEFLRVTHFHYTPQSFYSSAQQPIPTFPDTKKYLILDTHFLLYQSAKAGCCIWGCIVGKGWLMYLGHETFYIFKTLLSCKLLINMNYVEIFFFLRRSIKYRHKKI